MKRLTLFESGIIGLFVGAVAATYLVFLNSSGAFVGQVLSWISLSPLLKLTGLPSDKFLVIPFLFYVVVFTLYGVIVGLIVRLGHKVKIGLRTVAVLLLVTIYIEQNSAALNMQKSQDISIPIIAAVSRATNNVPVQYFGNETIGDLNGDGINDVAFVILRNEPERGTLYYLVASIKIDGGHAGTNLLYFGDKIEPKNFGIRDGEIIIEYVNHGDKVATSTKFNRAKLNSGVLEWVKVKK